VAGDLEADVVVDTSRDDLVSAVLDATNGTGADAALDTVGGGLLDPVLATLRHGGRATVIASVGGPMGSLNVLELYRNERSVSGVNTLDLSLVKAASILDILRRGFESGALHAPATLAFPLDEAAAAYKTVLSGTGGTKVVLLP
jgi:NADPH:quinone reductase-like Zn-dependent oxidoreductase